MKKIFISLFLGLILLCQSVVVPGVLAEDYSMDEQDINLLMALGLLKGDVTGDLRLEDSLLRSEYTAMILRLMGFGNLEDQTSVQSSFTDVSDTHWAKAYIQFAKGINLVEGVGENLFEPDRKVNRDEAIKIMVSALGYGEVAELEGGFPSGYEKQAAKLGLLKNTDYSSEFTREDACRLMINSLRVDVMDDLGNVVSGQDVLKKYLDIEIFEGYITGTEEIYAQRKVNEGHIEIDNVMYKNSHNTTDELFGCFVEFYLHSDGTNETVCYIEVIEDDSRLEITSDNILPQTNLETFCYIDEDDDEESVDLTENLVIYYNGMRIGSADMDASLLIPEQGNVILCSSSGGKEYDMAIVYDYRTVKVDYADESAIYDIYKNHINLNIADDITIIRDGSKIELSELVKGDVIAVAESFDKERVKILADFTTVSGNISQVKKSGNGSDIYVIVTEDDILELEVAASFTEAMENGLAENWFEPDRRILSFDIDAFGRIADVSLADDTTANTDSLQYGYLIETNLTGTMGGEALIKILTADNRFKVFSVPVNKKVLFGRDSGIGYVENTVTSEVLVDTLGGSGSTERQIIKYRADSHGVLKEIYLAADYVDVEVISEDVPNSFHTYRQGVLTQRYYMDDSTVVFSIPENAVYEDVMSAGGYKNFFSEGWGKYCTLYDVDNGHVGAVVINNAVAITYGSPERGYEMILNYASSPVFLINKVLTEMTDDGDIFVTMEGYQNGKLMSVNISRDLSDDAYNMSLLRSGAVIQYEKNSNAKSWAMTADDVEQMVVFEQVFDFEAENSSGIRWDHDIIIDDNPDILTLWGTLEKIDPAYCSVMVEENNKQESYAMQIMNNAVFFKYDNVEKIFEPITRYELAEGQQIYIAKQSSGQVFVIY